MGGNRGSGRKLVVALGAFLAFLLACLIWMHLHYTSVIGEKDAQIQALVGQVDQLQKWLQGNSTHYASQVSQLQKQLEENIALLNSLGKELNSLRKERENLILWLQGNKTLLAQVQRWLQGNITYYISLVKTLNSQIMALQSQVNSLQSRVNSLEAPKLIQVDLRAEDVRPWLGSPYLRIYGYVCNVGKKPAYDSKIHVVAYQSGGVVAINTEVHLGTIEGESWTRVDAKVYYSGGPLTMWTLSLKWTP